MSYVDQLRVPQCEVAEEAKAAVGQGRLHRRAEEAEPQSAPPRALGMERFGSITANRESW